MSERENQEYVLSDAEREEIARVNDGIRRGGLCRYCGDPVDPRYGCCVNCHLDLQEER